MKAIILTLVGAALVLVAAALIFIYSGVYDVSASKPHGSLSGWLMHATMEASVERRADDVGAPDLSDPSLLLSGVNDFEAMCVGCHGAPGKEPGPIGKGLNPAAPDLAESAREMTPEQLFWVTRNGIRMSGMPAWGATHDDEDLWPVVALMAALPELDGRSYRELKDRAAGMGHHASDSATGGHAHDDAGEENHGDHGHGDSGGGETGQPQPQQPAEEAEHDHSTHKH